MADPAAQLDGPSADGATFADPLSNAEPAPRPASVQIASAVLQRDGVPIDGLRVALEPAELGSVELTLTSEGRRKARALVLVDRPETLELLQREQRTLERILIASGLELEPSGLELGLRRDGDRRDGPFTPWTRGAPVGEPARSVPSGAPPRLLGLRLLDLVV